MKAKVNILAKPHLFHTTVRQCMGGFLKRITSLLLAVHGCSLVLRPLPPPTWPGNEASMALLVALCYTEPLQQLKAVIWSRLQTYNSVIIDIID